MFSKHGWLVLIWGILFLPVGFGIQAIAGRLLNFFSEEMRILRLLPIPHLPSSFRHFNAILFNPVYKCMTRNS